MSITKESTRIAALAAGAAFAVAGNAGADEGPRLAKDQYVCRPITKENLKAPPPIEPDASRGENARQTQMIRQFAEEAKLSESPCAPGQVPYPRQGDENVQHPGPGFSPEREEKSAPVAPPRDGTYASEVQGGYRYVGAMFETPSLGGFVDINVARPPEVSSPRGHSIGQILFAGIMGSGYTVELGWQSHLGYYGGSPRLFTFVNKDHYSSYGSPGGDCYNCHFVPLPGADYVLGQELPVAAPPLNFVTLKFGLVQLEGDWWVWVGDQWIGYLEGEFWPEPFSYAWYHNYYGEIFDLGHATDMGNGYLGTDERASVMANPQAVTYKDPNYQLQDEELSFWAENYWTDIWGYMGGNVSEDRDRWKFGGPGLE